MELIDILVQHKEEIVELGEATNYLAMDPDGRVFGYQEKPDPSVVGWSVPGIKNSTDGNGCIVQFNHIDLKDNWRECIVTRGQYEAALAASKKEWNGEGFPSVGIKCEHCPGGTTQHEWEVVTVAGIYENLVTGFTDFWLVKENGSSYTVGNPYRFRPIRSEADKKRAETEKAIADALFTDGDFDFSEALRLATFVYGAMYLKKIPHIRID